jgi:hypothetical protein
VAVTAPGETVWTASVVGSQYCVTASDGTSFATATTAGIAALWLSYHRQVTKANLGSAAQIPATFREVLKRSGHPAHLPSSGFGAGLVDAAQVLGTPIGTAATQEAMAVDWCPGPDATAFRALESVFRGGADGRARAGTILNTPNICGFPQLADEVSFWYSTDDGVAAAFAPLALKGTPSAGDYDRVRRALQQRDISSRLRARLGGVQR